MNMKEYEKVWDKHYSDGGNSGIGSYNEHFEYKTNIINDIIEKYQIKNIIDFGCGDGNQISNLNIEEYLGVDVSIEAVKICQTKYKDDLNKKFELYDETFKNKNKTDLTLSLDVIYHIILDESYYKYMNDLINSTNKYVLIYSSNFDDLNWESHVRHRQFDKQITQEFELIKKINNILPNCSADFYLYKKK